MTTATPPPVGPDLGIWARRLNTFLLQRLPRLQWKSAADTAAENGVILWDEANGYPVVSKDGSWRQIILEDGHYTGGITSDVTAASADTAYALTFVSTNSSGIDNGTPGSRLVFDEAGEYLISFSAQIQSTNASTVNFWFWPKVNGADVPGSTIKSALHQNDATTVVSRAAIFDFNAGDYLEAYWAVSSTSGTLKAFAAETFAPATPSATISITRVHG
jgi:hypothetical protein